MITLNDPKVAEHFQALPESLKTAIRSSGWEASMRQIAAENKLHIDQADTIGTEVMLVMIGLADPAEFPATILEEAHLNEDLAEKVTIEINERIFKLIRGELIGLYRQREHEESEKNIESREELLAEIEKSEPVTLGLSRMPGSAKPVPQAEHHKAEEKETAADGGGAEDSAAALPAVPPPPPVPVPSPLFARKMEERTQNPAQAKMIEMPRAAPEPRIYSVDPYREAPTP